MKMQVVTWLWMLLTVISFSGCSGIYFSKCVTPDIKYPSIDNTRCGSYECVHDKVLTNYETMKKYAKDLEDANGVCK